MIDLHYEHQRAQELFAIARQMTLIGMAGEDPDDPKVKNFLDHALNRTDTEEELRSYCERNWRR